MEIILVIAIGLVFGSFITCVSYRLPLGLDIVKKPSYCPACDAKLTTLDLFPLFSWLFSRGKCCHCGVKVSARYPMTELATAGTFLLIYSFYGLSAVGIILMVMAVLLLIMIVVDFEHYIIPDSVHLFLLPLGFAFHFARGSDASEVVSGLALGGGIGLALHYGYKWLRKKDGLGFGDVKFLAVAGLWLGLKPIVPFLFFSGVLGVATGLLWRVLKRGNLFPFGPALAVSLFICVAFPELSDRFWNIYNFMK
ncbi:MAG: prepilin peptidase [Alphaproteobacteria bacterium]|nr:prepilin peptidase [Alphaproteobacteria bacterium]